VRPSFFCGQLLADTDLAALVDWTRTRLNLSRYRHGWGVVCGLEVTCTSPTGSHECCSSSQKGPTVYVNRGYALDCCGNDLVVCEPLPVDLTAICKPLKDRCNPTKDPRAVTPAAGNPAAGTSTRTGGTAQRDCWDMRSDEIVAVELTLRYSEELAQGQRAVFRGNCSDAAACEHTRVLERPCVHAEIAPLERSDDDKAKEWDDRFKARADRVWREIEDAVGRGVEAVLKYVRSHPPYRFCFLEDYICCLMRDRSLYKIEQTRVSVWLFYDWMLHELECQCWSCQPDEGVPLGRLLLRRVEPLGQAECRVLLIDTSVPHRRPLRRDPCRPIGRDAVDLAPYLFQRRHSLNALRMQGVKIAPDRGTVKEEELRAHLIGKNLVLEVGPDQGVRALLTLDPFGTEWIAGFEIATL
jgi:hypothetical protein